ncbi:MAG: hypothetical protein KOO69_00255 [Victivallales bacterium]|nr:hypothetical protein [Victivallales bacterium]
MTHIPYTEKDALEKLEKRFRARYETLKLIRGKAADAKIWKRAWLDIRNENNKIRKSEELTENNYQKYLNDKT